MALQASGNPIKYSQIIAEFGTPNTGGLGQFRLDGGENVGSLTQIPLDVGVPKSVAVGASAIAFSDFYSKRLNQIIDLHSSSVNNTFRQDAKQRWFNGNVHIVGSTVTGKGIPADTEDDRVIINVNQKIGSAKGTQTHCAMKTGDWDTGTILEIEIGSSGKLYGSGGDGGNGGDANGNKGEDGTTGSSALGIEYPCSINNLGVIQSGYGGGGGGGGYYNAQRGSKKGSSFENGSSGGGGGGGAGFPAGNAGISNEPYKYGNGSAGSDGEAGKLSDVATGGAGGSSAGDGGDSGGINLGRVNDSKASDGETDVAAGHGTGGDNGYAIITNQGSAPAVTGNAILGRTVTSTNPT